MDKFVEDHNGYKVLFFGFKDMAILTQGFLLFSAVRSITYSLIVTLIYRLVGKVRSKEEQARPVEPSLLLSIPKPLESQSQLMNNGEANFSRNL